MLTEFFRIYAEEREPTKYLYREIPEYYRWIPQQRIWKRRVSRMKAIGRQVAEEYWLVESDNSISQALAESREIRMPKALRRSLR
ncbi:hypothetical protein LIER_35535 [Lithospermum erythrorhizon]|uniref:Uncharacterized protein n=1 Tax=Lithospermum erythrorhizon TaxID=34254 RepID=A0AAV3NSM3_LITER